MGIREQKSRLPEIKLTTYCHDPSESREKFIYNFENILRKHTLSSYENFFYFRSMLSKSPKVLIDSLDVAEQTYQRAKKLLHTNKGFQVGNFRAIGNIKKVIRNEAFTS